MNDPALIDSLRAAVAARPDDHRLRLHLAELLLGAGRGAEAVGEAATVLAGDPQNAAARAVMAAAIGAPAAPAAPADPAPAADPAPRPGASPDWAAWERDLGEVVPAGYAVDDDAEPVAGEQDRMFDVEQSGVRLSDVGGLVDVKKRLELSFLGPLRNPELRSLYRKSLRGGLLLYGPPGCGKTFLARAVAGEMGARLINLSIVDVLNMWIGSSERNLHEIFQAARRNAPCVVFLDEIDALGHKRSQMASSAMRTLVNQLLAELDGMDGDNEGVFVLAATNAPWDVDPALRRPGRFDRTVLVLPPDAPARTAILQRLLRDRPIEGIDLKRIVAATEDYSGADLSHLCDTAAEYAMHDSITSGEVRQMRQGDFDHALREVRPSTGAWLSSSRNVVAYGNEDGTYDDLAAYLKKRRML
ncbi:cell division control protein 48 CDC48 [Catellatospora sp. TT07R-123]|uniref:ATP-binding protein n=1 Tax=Catellatospora sp. TT07R-123 TaxID=2733863 RepID=UPI001B2A5E00|nr:ATP-binding protein [Catellatospora sp. TT07R-123]GHJ43800.1 cell division control protein 48 CDC48 [Catellatospora sp. TT07R-123]